MKNEKKKKEEEKGKLLPRVENNPVDEGSKVNIEISEESQQERLFLEGMLLHETEILTPKEQKAKKDAEIVELRSGDKYTIGEINDLVTPEKNPYIAFFPNDVCFFSGIYTLNGWDHLNPKDYNKPPIVGVWINEIIYGRFPKEVLPYLQYKNPPLPGSFRRKYKHSQYLNESGQDLLIQYRKDAVDLMDECIERGEGWYIFRKKLFKLYEVPYQIEIFEKND